MFKKLTVAISLLASEIKESLEQRKIELEWFKSHYQLATKRDLERWIADMAKTQAEIAQTLTQVVEQQKKTVTEIQTLQTETNTLKDKIVALEKVIADGPEVTPELEAAVEAVKAQAQVVDDAIPDAPPVPPVE